MPDKDWLANLGAESLVLHVSAKIHQNITFVPLGRNSLIHLIGRSRGRLELEVA